MSTCTLVRLADYTSQSQAQSTLSTAVGVFEENTVTEFWIVNFDGPSTSNAAKTATDGTNTVPGPGDAYAGDATQFCTKVMSKPNGDTLNSYIVQVDYTDAIPTNPLDLPADIAWDFDEASEPYFLDNTPGTPKPVVNSAGEPFENLLEREAAKLKCTVKKNQASYSPSTAITYSEVVNSDSFSLDGVTITAGQAKLKSMTAGPVQTVKIGTSTISYREVTYTMHFRPLPVGATPGQNWDDLIEDRGYNETDGSNGLKAIKKGNMEPLKPDKPWPLDGAGAAKAKATDTPFQLDFKPYITQAFSAIASNFV